MKKLDTYIIEKLKIDKDTKIENPYKGVSLETTLSHFMGDLMRKNVEITMYDVSKTDNDEIIIETNNEIRIYYPQIKKSIEENFGDYYDITSITWSLAQSKIIIKYEESK